MGLEDSPALGRALRFVIQENASLFAKAARCVEFDDPYRWVDANTVLTKFGDIETYEDAKQYRKEVPPLEVLIQEIPEVIPSRLAKACKLVRNNPYVLGCGILSIKDFPTSTKVNPNICVGRIASVQERGFKARIVASPKKCHQMALSKLGNFLYWVLRRIEGDCTYSQESGILAVQSALTANQTVYCHDLSDATNNFPLILQIEVLYMIKDCLHPDDWDWFEVQIQLFEWLSQGSWVLPDHLWKNSNVKPKMKEIYFTVGTPQGLVAAFPLFALSHNLLIMAIEVLCHEDSNYRVLGDDMFMSSKPCSDMYLEIMGDTLGVPINEGKSIISSEVGEFGGKVITKNGPLNVEKWKFSASTPSYLSYYRWLGMVGEGLVPHRYRGLCSFIASLPSPLGLGLNPKGLSFDSRLPTEAVTKYEMLVQGTSMLPKITKSEVERRVSLIELFTQDSIGKVHTPMTPRVLSRRPDEVDSTTRGLYNLYNKILSGHLNRKMKVLFETRVEPLVRGTSFVVNSVDGPYRFFRRLYKKVMQKTK
jgi:hypothetical protein